MSRTSIFIALMLLAACRVDRCVLDNDDVVELDDCALACQKMQDLKCPGWESEPGAPCPAVCRNAQQGGGATMKPECVKVAEDCAAAERCFGAE